MTTCNHCAGFTRSQLLRQGVAQAGNGIRAIEPGMPIPAGTGLTRRTLITRGAAGALAVYGASRLEPRPAARGHRGGGVGHAEPHARHRSSCPAAWTR